MEMIVVLGIIIVVLLVVAIKGWLEARKLQKRLNAKDEGAVENAKQLQNFQKEKEEATKSAKEAEEKLYLLNKHYDALGIKCVPSPYQISWNDSDVTFLTQNAFVQKGYIYPNPDNGKDQHGSLVVVINKATKEYIFLDFMDDAPKV